MKPKSIIILVIVAISIGLLISLFTGMAGINDGQNWIYLQHLSGDVKIVDNPGFYWKRFGKTWIYPRYVEFIYNDDPADGAKAKESIKVTFNDGGTADISIYIRLGTPLTRENRIGFHQQFGGSMKNIKASTKAHMIYCLKSTAPLMSSSENQSARKAEFQQVVEGQLIRGTYKMKKEAIKLKDDTDKIGREITIFKTEIITDADGMPVVVNASPIISKFNMTIVQFSVTGTAYDEDTRKQFTAKKASFLLTEQAKADREKETQERLMIIEKGYKEKAQAEAVANVLKATAVIAAEQKAEVALQTKIQAETKASQLLSVAEINKKEVLMIASAKLEVAQIKALEAIEEKKATILKAQGRKEAIELSGDITQLEEALINAEVEKARVVSENLAKIRVPEVLIISNGDGKNSEDQLTKNLINIRLMEATGIFDKIDVNKTKVSRKVRE